MSFSENRVIHWVSLASLISVAACGGVSEGEPREIQMGAGLPTAPGQTTEAEPVTELGTSSATKPTAETSASSTAADRPSIPALSYVSQATSTRCWDAVEESELFLPAQPGAVRVFEGRIPSGRGAMPAYTALALPEGLEVGSECAPSKGETHCNGTCLTEGQRSEQCDSFPNGFSGGQDGPLVYFYEDQLFERFKVRHGKHTRHVVAGLDATRDGWVPVACHVEPIFGFALSEGGVHFLARRISKDVLGVFRAEDKGTALLLSLDIAPTARPSPRLHVFENKLVVLPADGPGYAIEGGEAVTRTPSLPTRVSVARHGGYEYLSHGFGELGRVPIAEPFAMEEAIDTNIHLIGAFGDYLYATHRYEPQLLRINASDLEVERIPMTGNVRGMFNGRLVLSPRVFDLTYTVVDLDTGESTRGGSTSWDRGMDPRAYASNRSIYAFDLLHSYRIRMPPTN